jgi:two-component system LytT family response regulator
MKIFNAIVIDDEYHIREAMRLHLEQNCPQIRLCGMASSAAEGRKMLEEHVIDLIFLDISMPSEDGFAFLGSIDASNYAVIFVTAYQEFALKALKANAIDYLLKPVDAIELRDAVHKATDYLEVRRRKAQVMDIYTDSLSNLEDQLRTEKPCIEKLTIHVQFGFRIVEVKDIMYLEADSSYTVMHFSSLEKLVVSRSLGEFEKILEGCGFIRIHKSSVINLRFLKSYSSYQGNYAELTDGTKLDISRRKLAEFRDAVSTLSKDIN